MNKHLQHLFLFEKFEIQTKLSKQEILKRIEAFADSEHTDYYGSVAEGGFYIAEKNRKYFAGGHTQNPFAPIARGKIDEKDGGCSVCGVLRINALALILFAPIYLISLLMIVPFPIMLIILHFAFVKPAKRLKDALEEALKEDDYEQERG